MTIEAPSIDDVENLYHILAYFAEKKPSDLAVKDSHYSLSYAELKQLVDDCATSMLSNDLGQGSRVICWSDPNAQFLVTFLAAASIGCLWLGFNPKYRHFEMNYLLEDFQPHMLISIPSVLGEDAQAELDMALQSADPNIKTGVWPRGKPFPFSKENDAPAELEKVRQSVVALDPCAIVYTSGTTGKPKGAILTHQSVTTSARLNAGWLGDCLERTLCNFPINHVACLNNLSMNTLVVGGAIYFQPRFDPGQVLDAVTRERITCLSMVPTMLAAVVAFPEFERTDFSSIELLYWGGAAVPLHLAELVQRKEIRCGVIYGQSETTGIVTRGIAENGTTCEDASTTVGTPLDGIEWRLADPNTGFPGIRGRNLAFTPCNPLFLLSILPVFSQAFKWASFWPIYDVP